MEIKKICSLIEERQNELFELLSSMIKINSESFKAFGNEQPMAEYVLKLCKELGLESEMYSPLDLKDFKNHPDYFEGRGLENRYNVSARWEGKENKDSLLLMAHTDTVEIGDTKNWERDPLSGEIIDGKIFGRGACDDKYAIASALFIIKLLKEEGFVPSQNLVFCAYSDEEYGGSHGALAGVLKTPCDSILSMDGRDGQIWHCGSGGGEMKYIFHTKETVDSAEYTAKALPIVLEEIGKFKENRRKELSENRFYKGTIIPDTSLRYMGVRAGNDGMDLGRGEAYFVFYTDKTKEEVYKEFDEIDLVIKKRLEPLGIIGDGFKPATRFFHYVHCEPDSEDVVTLLNAAKEASGEDILVCGSCLSDLSVISKYGSSRAYGYGAGRDFSEKGGAHQPNEYIECERLVQYTKNIAAYILAKLGV